MNRNWRLVLPPRYITILLCVAYIVTYLMDLWCIHLGISVPKDVGTIRMPFLVLASALYGYYRFRAFHPFYSRKYREWLCLTPWSIEKPLPRGPVHLIWADLITLVPLTILAYSNYSDYFTVPLVVFLAVYLLGICITFEGKETGFVVLCIFLAPFAVYPFANLYIALMVLMLLYMICWFGLRQFLRGFPWNTKYWKADMVKELREQAIRQRVIGWPFSILNIYEISGISVLGAFVLSLLLTWWLHVIQWIIEEPLRLGWLVILTSLVTFFRAGAYACEYRPPISLLGRILTGHLIIPKYDKIYVAPICIVMAGTLLPFALGRLGVNSTLNFELCFFLIFFLALSLPPTLNKWRLTGAYRVGRLAQSLRPKPPSPQDQAVAEFFSSKFKSSE